MIDAFTAYGRSVAVIFACALAIFIAQEVRSVALLAAGALLAGTSAVALWRRFRGTYHRFLVGVMAVIAITFLTFLANMAYPKSGISYGVAFLLVASLAFFALYAFIRPKHTTEEE
jgi:uncharacterized membrane protein